MCLGRVGNDAELAAVGLGNMMQKLVQHSYRNKAETIIYNWIAGLHDEKKNTPEDEHRNT